LVDEMKNNLRNGQKLLKKQWDIQIYYNFMI